MELRRPLSPPCRGVASLPGLIRCCAVLVTLAVLSAPAAAMSDDWQFKAGPATDKVTRGMAISDGHPSVSAGANWYHVNGTAGLTYQYRAWQSDVSYIATNNEAKAHLGPGASNRWIADAIWHF